MTCSTAGSSYSFYKLDWDSNFFKISCAKAILHKPLTLPHWDELKKNMKGYQLVTIQNENSDPLNAQLIGKDTSAILVDVNIQFIKELKCQTLKPEGVIIRNSLEKDERLLEIACFEFSRFTEDPELLKRGGNLVYQQWVLNSFDKPEKYFALSVDDDGSINGFLLHSFLKDICLIELIAVSRENHKKGIGTKLFNYVEDDAYKRGVSKIRVGTQLRNISAINFYHRVGCKQVGCHQIYHLWS